MNVMTKCEICEIEGLGDCDTCPLTVHDDDSIDEYIYRADYLYGHIDQFIQDEEVFPVCVPSYNRPNGLLLRYAETLPMVMFIRREQQDMYSQYQGKCEIVLLDNVCDAGTTRAAIVDWAWQQGYKNIFMLDDDITNGDFMVPGVGEKSGKDFMKAHRTMTNTPEKVELWFFKMWMWMIKHCSPKLTLSSPATRGDNWAITNMNKPVSYNSGASISCIHLNVKNLKDNNINYGSNSVEGAEDYALQYKIMSEGLYTAVFKDLLFRVPQVGAGKGGNVVERDKLEQRYYKYIQLFKDNVLDSWNADKIGTKVSRGGIPSIRFIWSRWRIQDEQMMYTADSVHEELLNLQNERCK